MFVCEYSLHQPQIALAALPRFVAEHTQFVKFVSAQENSQKNAEFFERTTAFKVELLQGQIAELSRSAMFFRDQGICVELRILVCTFFSNLQAAAAGLHQMREIQLFEFGIHDIRDSDPEPRVGPCREHVRLFRRQFQSSLDKLLMLQDPHRLLSVHIPNFEENKEGFLRLANFVDQNFFMEQSPNFFMGQSPNFRPRRSRRNRVFVGDAAHMQHMQHMQAGGGSLADAVVLDEADDDDDDDDDEDSDSGVSDAGLNHGFSFLEQESGGHPSFVERMNCPRLIEKLSHLSSLLNMEVQSSCEHSQHHHFHHDHDLHDIGAAMAAAGLWAESVSTESQDHAGRCHSSCWRTTAHY